MPVREIVLPEAKPAWEWVRGRALQKVSPRFEHGLVQGRVLTALTQWARDRGLVATELDVRVTGDDGVRRPLVPDVAFISSERLAALAPGERSIPPLAPDIVVEVLSPGDAPADIADKRDLYLAAGTQLVLLADPRTRTITAIERAVEPQIFGGGRAVVAAAFPDLAIDVAPIFADLDRFR